MEFTCNYPDLSRASDWLKQISHAVRPLRSTTQNWLMSRHQSQGEREGGYSGFQVTGKIAGFLGGLKFSIAGFFAQENFGKYFWSSLIYVGSFFGYSKQSEDS